MSDLQWSRLLLPAACYAVILGLSSVPADEYARLQLPAGLSYAAHAVEYGALGAALRWALDGLRWPLPLVAGLALVGGAGDEGLQSTVPGRDPSVLDLAVDVAAATIAALVVARLLARRAGRRAGAAGQRRPGARRRAGPPRRNSRGSNSE